MCARRLAITESPPALCVRRLAVTESPPTLCVRRLAVTESLPRLGGLRIPAPVFHPESFSSLAQALGAQRLCSVSPVLGRPGWVGGGWKKDTRLRPVPSPSTSNSDVDLLLLPQSELGLSSSPSLCTWLVTELSSQSTGKRPTRLGGQWSQHCLVTRFLMPSGFSGARPLPEPKHAHFPHQGLQPRGLPCLGSQAGSLWGLEGPPETPATLPSRTTAGQEPLGR